MRNFFTLFTLSLFLLVGATSCEQEEPLTPEQMLTGKWIIQSSEILGTVVPGDGSFITFNACDGSTCTGTDFEATDNTSGTYTYSLASDASTITIDDSTSDGGNYNGTWDILELTETDFRIVGNTLFGSLKMEMTKE